MSELKAMRFFEAVPTSKEGFYQPGAFVDGYLKSEVDKVIAHNKYKRCLAMAEWCKARYDEEDAKLNRWGSSWDYVSKKMKYWERWQWRWEELAEEPTWARFLQLIHKEAK